MVFQKSKAVLLLSALSFFVCFSFAPTIQASSIVNSLLQNRPLPSSPDAISSCNLFYTPDSINFSPISVPVNAVPGKDFVLRGFIISNGRMLINDASIYAKIKKVAATSSVEEFVEYTEVVKDININSAAQTPFSYSWKVPNNIPDGDYALDFF